MMYTKKFDSKFGLKHRKRGFRRVGDNDNAALIPQIWAKYALAILESNMVAGQLVYRDFEASLAAFGDTVKTRKPAALKVLRKSDADNVTNQDVASTNIDVKLDLHPHVSFTIKDGEETMALQSLVDYYLTPAMIAMAEHIDSCILGEFAGFMNPSGVGGQTFGSVGGRIGGLLNNNYQQYLTEVGEALDEAKCPMMGRSIIVPPAIKRLVLQNQTLVQANTRGDQGTALRSADMGTIYGFDHYMCQNMSSFIGVDEINTFLANGAKAIGTATIVVDTGTGIIATGTWVQIGGYPYQVSAHTETAGNTTGLTLVPPLRAAMADNDAIKIAKPGAVNLAAGYAAGWSKPIAVDGFTAMPKVGQYVSFGTTLGNIYTVVAADATTITLNRALTAALADNDAVNGGLAGDYGWALHKNAVSLVIRPLRLPRAGTGALSGVANYNGLSMRVVIAYDAKAQGHIVTLDCLMGVTTLDKSYGAVLLA